MGGREEFQSLKLRIRQQCSPVCNLHLEDPQRCCHWVIARGLRCIQAEAIGRVYSERGLGGGQGLKCIQLNCMKNKLYIFAERGKRQHCLALICNSIA